MGSLLIRFNPPVLEKVRDILSPLAPPTDVGPHGSDVASLKNRFAGLSVYEPSQRFLDAPDVQRPNKVQHDEAVYEAEPQTSFEDAIFALATLLDDMNRIKACVVSTWSNYKTGVFDLAAAAVTTDTAIGLVRSMAEDVLPLIEPHGGCRKMLQTLYFTQCVLRGWTESSLTVAGKDNFNYSTWDMASDTYFGAYRLLEAFLAVLEPDQVPLYKAGTYGSYDPTTDHSQKPGPEKWADDRALLMPMLAEMMTVVRAVRNWPVQDEFMRGIQELDRNGRVPLYAVFAAQVFLDVTYQLGPDIQQLFHTMVEQTNIMQNDIKAHFEFHRTLKIDNWPASNDRVLRDLQETILGIGKDPVRQAQDRLYRRMGMATPDTESYLLLRMSPVLSGVMLYHFRSRYREAGLAVADAWGSIQYSQHLYHAVRCQRLMRHAWPDMDVLQANLGDGSFYVGGEAPRTAEESFKKFCLQMGTSAAAMGRRRRKNTPLPSKTGPRGLREASPVLSTFKTRYTQDGGRMGLSSEDVSRIIQLSLFEDEDGTGLWAKIDDPEKLKEKRKKLQQQNNSPQRSGKAAIDGSRLAPPELLESLVISLHAETVEFAFPYLNMHR